MIDRAALLRDLKPQLRLLEDDLRRRSAEVPEFDETLRLEWEDARQSNRTAATYESWLDDRVTQSAVAWILATVFVRFCEDNGLIDLPVIAGPGDRLAIAGERQNEYIAENRATTDRDWILQGIRALSVSKVAAGLFDEAHNPMWTVTPSHDAAKALLAFWRRRAESGEIVHDFTEPDWNTRSLGDLYQDLSEPPRRPMPSSRPRVRRGVILDYTLTPAIEEFGLTPDPPEARPDLPSLLRVIDPTCGSGHFLLGAFRRLLAQWEKRPRRRQLGADLPSPVLGPRRGQEPFRRRDSPLPSPHRRDEGRRRKATGHAPPSSRSTWRWATPSSMDEAVQAFSWSLTTEQLWLANTDIRHRRH